MTTSTQLFDLITVLESTNLTAEDQAHLNKLRESAEQLRALEATQAGAATAQAVGVVTTYTLDTVGHVGARATQFLGGFFGAMRK